MGDLEGLSRQLDITPSLCPPRPASPCPPAPVSLKQAWAWPPRPQAELWDQSLGFPEGQFPLCGAVAELPASLRRFQ